MDPFSPIIDAVRDELDPYTMTTDAMCEEGAVTICDVTDAVRRLLDPR